MITDFWNSLSFVYDSSSKSPFSFNTKEFLVLFLVFYGIYCIKFVSFKRLFNSTKFTANLYESFLGFLSKYTKENQEKTEKDFAFYARLIYVSLFSLYFYYLSSGFYFWLLIFSSIVDYSIAKYIHETTEQSKRKTALILSLFINLGLLSYFKYTNFFIDNINFLVGTKIEFLKIFLPIGISFYTFQTMSYTIDVYRKNLKPTDSFLDFLFFVSFFPQLVAGPIVRASQFIPQIRRKNNVTDYHIDKALLFIMGGLIKKCIIADYIGGNFVRRVFEAPEKYSGFENLLGTYGYTVQIYCDFSGYSDIAIGLALLMGFKLPMNFRSPYQSKSITEFWRRWHISLSFWLRDYLYISLGGNRRGKIRTYINLFLVMFFGGLWHGASWKFVIWGMLHGVMLAIERFFKEFIRIPKNAVTNFIKWFLTLHFVIFCWIFFGAQSFDKALIIIKNIGEIFTENIDVMTRVTQYKYIILLIIISFITHLTPDRYFFKGYKIFKNINLVFKPIMLGLVFWLVYLVMNSEIQPFIYFQF